MDRNTSALERTDRRTKTRSAHHLAGVHKCDTPYSARTDTDMVLYSWRRVPCEKPTGTGASWRTESGRVNKKALWSQPLRDSIHEES